MNLALSKLIEQVDDLKWSKIGPIPSPIVLGSDFPGDVIYGRRQARYLAEVWPDLALSNVDNYVMYAVDIVYGAGSGIKSLRMPHVDDEGSSGEMITQALQVDRWIGRKIREELRREGCVDERFSWNCPSRSWREEHDEV